MLEMQKENKIMRTFLDVLLQHIIRSTDEDPSLRIESFNAIVILQLIRNLIFIMFDVQILIITVQYLEIMRRV